MGERGGRLSGNLGARSHTERLIADTLEQLVDAGRTTIFGHPPLGSIINYDRIFVLMAN